MVAEKRQLDILKGKNIEMLDSGRYQIEVSWNLDVTQCATPRLAKFSKHVKCYQTNSTRVIMINICLAKSI